MAILDFWQYSCNVFLCEVKAVVGFSMTVAADTDGCVIGVVIFSTIGLEKRVIVADAVLWTVNAGFVWDVEAGVCPAAGAGAEGKGICATATDAENKHKPIINHWISLHLDGISL